MNRPVHFLVIVIGSIHIDNIIGGIHQTFVFVIQFLLV